MTVLVFGSANADLVFPVRELPAPGRTVLGDGWHAVPGGKGANQAVGAAKDGARTLFVGAVGRDSLAEVATSGMRAAGVDLARLAVTDRSTGAASITVDAQGRNQIAVASGANMLVHAGQVEDALLGPGTVLVLQMEVPPAENEALIARARAAGARILLNLAPPAPISRETAAKLDLLIVNEHESTWLAGHLGVADTPPALREALGCDVLVTRGEEGAVLAQAGGLTRIPALPAQAIDTVGAGDCFCGVLAAGLDGGLSLEAALNRASAAAAIAVTRQGAADSMPLAAETDARLRG
ncbi:ribokinase [Acetobacteraceae bacterium H6797]|nr:ribokinase [Acetobacteraceae bacterium H6797]